VNRKLTTPVELIRQKCACRQRHSWTKLSRASVFAEVGPFNERLRHTEEVDYGRRLSARGPIWLTSAFEGRHRDDDKLWPLLRKVFHRCRLRVPFYVRWRRFARGFETATRVWSSLAAPAAVLTAPLPLLIGPPLAAVPLALLAASVLLDGEMYRFVLRHRGFRFAVGFAAVQFLVNVAIAVGIAAGLIQWLVSPAFRDLYDEPPVRSREEALR
jgi:hypothetical protein